MPRPDLPVLRKYPAKKKSEVRVGNIEISNSRKPTAESCHRFQRSILSSFWIPHTVMPYDFAVLFFLRGYENHKYIVHRLLTNAQHEGVQNVADQRNTCHGVLRTYHHQPLVLTCYRKHTSILHLSHVVPCLSAILTCNR